jgi:hypothetical protein
MDTQWCIHRIHFDVCQSRQKTPGSAYVSSEGFVKSLWRLAAPMVSRRPRCFATSCAITWKETRLLRSENCSRRAKPARSDKGGRMWTTLVRDDAPKLWRVCARRTPRRKCACGGSCSRWVTGIACTIIRCRARRISYSEALARSSSCTGAFGTGMRDALWPGCRNRAWNSGVQNWRQTENVIARMSRASGEQAGA